MRNFLYIVQRTGSYCCRHWRWSLVGIVLMACCLRLWRLHLEPFWNRDSYFYFTFAKKIAENGDWGALYAIPAQAAIPPGFFGLLAAGFRCGLSDEMAGLLVIFAANILLIVAIFWSLLGLSNRIDYALWGAWLAAISDNLIRLGASVLREIPYFSMVLLAVGAGIWAERSQRKSYWILFIIGASGAALIRKEGGEVVLAFCIFQTIRLFAALGKRRWQEAGKTLLLMIGVTGSVAAILLPIQLYFHSLYQSQWQFIPLEHIWHIWAVFRNTCRSF